MESERRSPRCERLASASARGGARATLVRAPWPPPCPTTHAEAARVEPSRQPFVRCEPFDGEGCLAALRRLRKTPAPRERPAGAEGHAGAGARAAAARGGAASSRAARRRAITAPRRARGGGQVRARAVRSSSRDRDVAPTRGFRGGRSRWWARRAAGRLGRRRARRDCGAVVRHDACARSRRPGRRGGWSCRRPSIPAIATTRPSASQAAACSWTRSGETRARVVSGPRARPHDAPPRKSGASGAAHLGGRRIRAHRARRTSNPREPSVGRPSRQDGPLRPGRARSRAWRRSRRRVASRPARHERSDRSGRGRQKSTGPVCGANDGLTNSPSSLSAMAGESHATASAALQKPALTAHGGHHAPPAGVAISAGNRRSKRVIPPLTRRKALAYGRGSHRDQPTMSLSSLDRIARALAGVSACRVPPVPHVYPSAAPAFVPAPMVEAAAAPGQRSCGSTRTSRTAGTTARSATLPVRVGASADAMARYVRCAATELEWVEPGRRSRSSSSAAARQTALPADLLDEVLERIFARARPDGAASTRSRRRRRRSTPEHIAVLKPA